uniref:Phosphoinositide phospholipase C n=1 Tax=Strongyloides stercoralis TaxID=6248 RepID=A0A913HGF2_STRER
MAKEYQFNWKPNIPQSFIDGCIFDKYDDESTFLDLNANVKIDEYGFYLSWTVDGKDTNLIDLVNIWESRLVTGPPKDGRILFELEQRGSRETLEERTVWITYGQDLVNINSFYIVAQDISTAKLWRNGINEILKSLKIRHVCPTTNLMKHWRFLCLGLNDRRKIPIKNIVKTFSSGKPERMVLKCLSDLGLAGDKYTPIKVIKKSWTKNLKNFYKCRSRKYNKKKEREELDVELFTFEKFLRLYHKICPRTEVQELFVKLSGQKEYLTRDKLITFLNEEQRDPRLNEILFPHYTINTAQALIAKFETDENYINNGKMSGDAFLRFLMSDENSPIFLDRTEMYQDMDQPLSHYYINSSHNTYLVGRQYGGKSSTEIYRTVLLSGCRCVELDCWDGTGENKGEPIITHGKAMCTDVFFKDVLYQIRDTAFARSDFPVILSFENHCSKFNQQKMAKYCMEIFGDMLLSKPLSDYPLEPGVPLPPPSRLKRKILIKNKRLKPEVEKVQMEQFLREGKLDEDDEITENPDVVGEDTSLPRTNTTTTYPSTMTSCGSSLSVISDNASILSLISSSSATAGGSIVSQLSFRRHHHYHNHPSRGKEVFERNSSFRIPSSSFNTSSGSMISNRNITNMRLSFRNKSPSKSGSGTNTGSMDGFYSSRLAGSQQIHSIFENASRRQSTCNFSVSHVSDNSLASHSEYNSSKDYFTSIFSKIPGTDGKEQDEAHPELKQVNFISKLKPLGFKKAQKEPEMEEKSTFISTIPSLTVTNHDFSNNLTAHLGAPLVREKRSFRLKGHIESSATSISNALLEFKPRRSSIKASKHSLKTILTKEEEERIIAEYHYTGATTNIHPLLSSLVNYTHPVKFSGFDVAEQNNLNFHMSSYSESTGLTYLKQNAPEFVNYNKRQLSRIYPKGARVDSSNFLPQIFWNAGCHMVSLNFQTPDVPMQLNQGKFEYNGNCGYLLKPDFMRRPDKTFDPFSESPVDGIIAATCSVRIISGQFICDRKVGTYVEVEMYGLPTDTIRKEHKTKTIPTNGLNPIYNEDPFVFRKVILPDLAVLRFAAYDENGKQLGQRILPLDGLQAGYRHISLRTETNMPTVLPTLFVHIVIKTYVPDEHSGLVDILADPRAFYKPSKQEVLRKLVDDEMDSEQISNEQGSVKLENGPLSDRSLGHSLLHDKTAPSTPSSGIGKNFNNGNNGSTVDNGKTSQPNSSRSTAETSDNKFKIKIIDIEEIKKDKAFIKLMKKQQKDIEELKKKHGKQRDYIQKQQQTNVDKLIHGGNRMSKKKRDSEKRSNPFTSRDSLSSKPTESGLSPEEINSVKMKSLVSNQTDEWSNLLHKQAIEEYDQKKCHIKQEFETLKVLLTEAQKQQMTLLKSNLDNEHKELKQQQTKKSMDDTKAIQQDKNTKNKAERDRRIKELNEKNVKVFVEERKRLAMKAQKHEEQLQMRHQNQLEILEKELSKALESEKMSHQETLLSLRPQSIV